MKTRTKVWLILAASLVLIGCILFAGVMTALNWDFSGLATVKYETNTYEIGEAFDSISVNTDTADIVFVLSDDGSCSVVCHEKENKKHSAAVEDGTLTVGSTDERSVSDLIGYIGLNFDSPKITVSLPETELTDLLIRGGTGDIEIPGDFTFENVDISSRTGGVDLSASVSGSVRIKTTTGDIRVKNVSAGTMDLSVSTGEIAVSDVTCTGDMKAGVTTGDMKAVNVTCRNLVSRGSTGSISLKNVIAAETFSIERSTGDVRFDRSDAAEIFVKTSTGDVTGSLLSEKVFVTETSTGRKDVPKTAAGGRCEITTSTGNIKIGIR